jgi:hypothetical protein
MMITETRLIEKQKTRARATFHGDSIGSVVAPEAEDNLIAEGGEGLYNYVRRVGLAGDPDMIVLSSVHNYYYDAEEINRAKTIIHLKELNKIKQIRNLLRSHLNVLPKKCNFVGFFVNNKKVDRFALRGGLSPLVLMKETEDADNGIISRSPFINRLYSLMDFRTNTYLSDTIVTLLLEENGFQVKDMTEYKGFTFFHSQKTGNKYN